MLFPCRLSSQVVLIPARRFSLSSLTSYYRKIISGKSESILWPKLLYSSPVARSLQLIAFPNRRRHIHTERDQQRSSWIASIIFGFSVKPMNRSVSSIQGLILAHRHRSNSDKCVSPACTSRMRVLTRNDRKYRRLSNNKPLSWRRSRLRSRRREKCMRSYRWSARA